MTFIQDAIRKHFYLKNGLNTSPLRVFSIFPGISQHFIRRLPLPPFREQHRIVAKIDGLFSEVDTHPAEFTSETLKQNPPLPIDWNEQRKLLGFPQI